MKNIWLASVLTAIVSSGIHAQNGMGENNFTVVVGAFAIKENADRFGRSEKLRKYNPKIEINKAKNLYYVYIMQTDNKEAALAESQRLRSVTAFNDAWVYNGILGEPVVREEPVVEKVVPVVVEQPKEEVKIVEPVPVPVDPAKLREEQIKKEVDSQSMVMKKGEKEILDHIYFFKDAAVLRPESKYQVDKLVQIMKENPTEKIRIHGHTNGDAPGKIIRRSDSNADFFSLDNTVEDYGSAKELSEKRANLIKEYLISKGIDSKRMSIKAEGGNKPIYNIDDEKAEANVRVEIEVMK